MYILLLIKIFRQQIINSDDTSYCLGLLNQHDWDISSAVQTAIASQEFGVDDSPIETQPNPSSRNRSSNVHVFREPSTSSLHFSGSSVSDNKARASPKKWPASGSKEHDRLLKIDIDYRGKMLNFNVEDSKTIGKLKELISQKLNIPKCKLVLKNWPKQLDRIRDEATFKSLQLPASIKLNLTTPGIFNDPLNTLQNSMSENETFKRLESHFELIVRCQNKVHTLKFPGSKTVHDIKLSLYHVTNIPVRYQRWEGWPADVTDSITLAGSSIQLPSHNLILSSSRPPGSYATNSTIASKSRNVVELNSSDEEPMDEDDDVAEIYDANDDLEFDETPASGRAFGALLPAVATDPVAATEQFAQEFRNRFGSDGPLFYNGSLGDALKEALLCRARDRKLLAVYLHHEKSISVNVFCSEILCSSAVVPTLSSSFVTWGWDCTIEANKNKFIQDASQLFGSIAANKLKDFTPDQYPLLVIISRQRSTNDVVYIINGSSILDEVISKLLGAQELFRQTQEEDIREEDQRMARVSMLDQQNQAYEASLRADQAKAEQKRKEKEENERREEEESRKQKELERRLKEEKLKREKIRQNVAEQLPAEPDEHCKQELSRIRIRAPDNKILNRRFLASNPLQILFNYLTSEGFHVADFKVLTTFPRRDLKIEDPTKSLKDLKLCPQETLILEAKSDF
ncbi:DgyrCDS1017 [Dimorphilus gyrociliatus]|uniref:DgyrCDS1017 n=1 Tax=Dimorphilus gyrociliatus TaxID=2664684 RepID=A0A7I8V6C4_9ANNE|nr:DgyrCDS1017 [Dimorphilus gyrociliatus]